MSRRLIVNADDFGQTAGINAGIIRSFEDGIVTSASLMVRWPAAEAAAEYAQRHAALSVGLHVDFGEWAYRDGGWTSLYQVIDPDDAEQTRLELARQLEAFRRLMRAAPTHLDSHQHVHRAEPARSAVREAAERLGIPVRSDSADVTYLGAFYGQGPKGDPLPHCLTADHLAGLLRLLPPGTTEMGCHPGLGGDAPGMYVEERRHEVDALCDPAVRATLALERIELISFRGLT